MNEIMNSLRERKSVRVYEDRPIPPEVREQILEAAFQAPTAGCQQLYTILEITSKPLKERLAVLCDNQPFVAKAPLVLVFLADCRRWLDSYRFAGIDARAPGVGDLMLAVSDAVIAAQNSVVAAESFGVGSCYIGDIVEGEEEVRELLRLDRYTFPATMVVYGYPTEQQRRREKPRRFGREYIVMENTYRTQPEKAHRAMFEERGSLAGKGFEAYLEAFCKRKYMTDFSAEMSRSVERYLENFRRT